MLATNRNSAGKVTVAIALVTVTHSEALADRMGRVLVLRDGKLADARVGA